MTASTGTKLTHLPALDGLRGLAVVGVLLFHGGFAAFEGGFLGVSTFFTLSGFLITSLLLREHAATGTIALRAFWARRFRRLLPAALAGLAVVCLYGWWFASPEQLATLRGDVFAALGYVANWRFVLEDKRYADLFSAPSPVQHFWSLAIEEQFYVVYPLLVVVALRFGGRRALTAVLTVLALASVAASFALSSDFDRVYYGTDTRAFELLAGALFALWWSAPERIGPGRLPPAVREALGAAGLLASLVAWYVVGQTSPRLARGGFALQALATVAVLVAVTAPGVVSRVLGVRPLRAVGLVSYGLYVYHWPVFLVLDEARTDLARLPLFVLRMVVTVGLALASYALLEQPIRRGRALQGTSVRVVAPVAVLALLLGAVVVTWDPPASKVAYANASLDDFAPRVVDLAPTTTTAAPAPTATGPTAVTTTTTPTVPAPGTVLVVGDSGMADLQPALAAVYGAMGTRRVVLAAGPGFGITRPEIDWRLIWGDLVEAHRPDVVVVMFGGWDLPWFRKNGATAYATLVDEAVRVLTARGARVHWLSMLPGGATPDRPVDPIFAQVAARHPGTVVYHDPEAVLRTGTDATGAPAYGRVRTIDGTRLLVRKPDVWHLCPEGAVLVAGAVVAHQTQLGWGPAAPTDWTGGPWRRDPAYNDPVGGCDARSAGADR